MIGRTMKTPSLLLAAVLLASPLRAEPPAAAPAGIVPMNVVKNVAPDDAAKLLKDHPKIVVLDVRTPEEFAAGRHREGWVICRREGGGGHGMEKGSDLARCSNGQ